MPVARLLSVLGLKPVFTALVPVVLVAGCGDEAGSAVLAQVISKVLSFGALLNGDNWLRHGSPRDSIVAELSTIASQKVITVRYP